MPSCSVCGAPPLARTCVFCRTPHRAYAGPTVVGLLDYLARRLPGAEAQRGGLLGRGAVRAFELRAGGERFAGRFRHGELELVPNASPAAWAERLLVALSREAEGDAEVRRAVSRSGWALRK